MSLFTLLKFLHVLLAITAVGANVTYGVWLSRAARDVRHLPFALRGVKMLDERLAKPGLRAAAGHGRGDDLHWPARRCGWPRLPAWALPFLALFDPTMRAVQDQLYDSEQPFLVDHSKYARAFGGAPTSHREAIQVTLQWYRGSLHTSG